VQYSGGTSVSYAYDALGRRVSETRGANVTDLYYSAAWQVVEERTGGNVTQYVWSPVYVDALIERDSGGQRLYVQQDANWNVTAIVDNTGAVKERNAYDPYGQPTFLDPTWATLASSAFAWLYLHQGGRRDGTTGLYNFSMRDYSPTLGRWMQEDPLRFGAGDSNLYGYVGSQPTGFTDPLGLLPQWTEITPDDGSGGGSPAPPPPTKNWFERCMDKYVGDPLFGSIAGAIGPDNLSGPITDDSIKQDLHTLLDLAGWVPVAGAPFTAADALLYGVDGKPGDAAKAGIGIIPIGKFGGKVGGKAIQEGIYIVGTKSEKKYVGQSGRIGERLIDHVRGGKITSGGAKGAKVIEVQGGKTAREIAEQQMIDQLGGVKNLDNIRNPIGPKRKHLLIE
jgi:RHS repeat-associated protein